jgi:hypothetical protein
MSEENDKYLNMSDDLEDLKHGFDGIEKTKAGLKIFGKSIFNIGKYAATEVLPEMTRRAEEERNKDKK